MNDFIHSEIQSWRMRAFALLEEFKIKPRKLTESEKFYICYMAGVEIDTSEPIENSNDGYRKIVRTKNEHDVRWNGKTFEVISYVGG